MTEAPPLQSGYELKSIMERYYFQVAAAPYQGQPVGWITAGGPVELLYAMDILPYYPENHSALCGARKVAVDLCQVAEGIGFSPDVCAYARCDFGYIHPSEGRITSPLGFLTPPTFVIGTNNQCGTVTKWYEVLSRHFNVPFIMIDAPFVKDELRPWAADYVEAQLWTAVRKLEEITGRKLSEEKLLQTAMLSRRTSDLWSKALHLAANRPSPWTAFDQFYHMSAIVTLRGHQQSVDYYEKLVAELENRVANGIGAVPNEKYRLLFDNIPPWYKIRDLSRKFASLGASVVASPYTNAWVHCIDFAKSPMRALAENYIASYPNRSLRYKADLAISFLKEFQADGFVLHSARSCKPFSLMQNGVIRIVEQELGTPCLMIDGDIVDSRFYSEAQVNTRIEAFIETLAARKG